MRRPVALFVGLRYLRASKGSGFVSFVNAASMAGVALGVATLIVVMSVMNGFENELRERLLGLTSHAAVVPLAPRESGGIADWQRLADGLRAQEGVQGAAPFVELEAMLSGPGGMTAAVLTGVAPEYERGVSKVSSAMLLGALEDLQPGGRRLLLGRALAGRLGVGLGDYVSVLVPVPAGAGKLPQSRLGGYTVGGIFEFGVQEHDSVRALLHLDDAAALLGNTAVSGIRIETDDIFAAPELARAALAELADSRDLRVRDWTEDNASYFRAIRLEKLMMALLLSLIIAVAAFNIVAMLVMIVTEKRGGIAILRTLGCSSREVVIIFLLQGTIIGWIGALAGIGLGVWMSLNVDTLAPAIETLFGFSFMPADLYYLTALPADLQIADVIAAGLGVLLITAVATIYPAMRAAGINPAEVLRYE